MNFSDKRRERLRKRQIKAMQNLCSQGILSPKYGRWKSEEDREKFYFVKKKNTSLQTSKAWRTSKVILGSRVTQLEVKTMILEATEKYWIFARSQMLVNRTKTVAIVQTVHHNFNS